MVATLENFIYGSSEFKGGLGNSIGSFSGQVGSTRNGPFFEPGLVPITAFINQELIGREECQDLVTLFGGREWPIHSGLLGVH
jgi:hypothetical protein